MPELAALLTPNLMGGSAFRNTNMQGPPTVAWPGHPAPGSPAKGMVAKAGFATIRTRAAAPEDEG